MGGGASGLGGASPRMLVMLVGGSDKGFRRKILWVIYEFEEKLLVQGACTF